MSEYVVIRKFTDKEDKHKYAVGDRYPFRGFAKKERVEELSTKKNARGVVLIEAKGEAKVEAKAETKAKKTESVEEKKEERPKRSSSKK